MFKSKLQTEFTTSHEREQYGELEAILKKEYSDKEETLILLGNYTLMNGIYKSEIDVIIIKKDAIIIIDLKDNKGKLNYSDSEKWTIDGEEVKAGSFTNPLCQVRSYKTNLSHFLKDNSASLSAEGRMSNFAHTSGVILFSREIDFNKNEIEGKLRSWFRITDMKNILHTVKNITSREIKLSDEDIDKILYTLKIDFTTVSKQISNEPTLKQVTITPVRKSRKIKETIDGKILDYYITCLEQEQLKQLELRVFRDIDNNFASKNNFRLLQEKSSLLFENDDSILQLDLNENINEFIHNEQIKPSPRTLFYGYSIITNKSNNYEKLYPVFYCQMKFDSVKGFFEKDEINECLFNRSFLSGLGFSDREEIELISTEIENLHSFNDKLLYVKKLCDDNNNDNVVLNNQSILFFSDSSSYIYNLLSELGEYGLSNDLMLKTLDSNLSKNLVSKFDVEKNSINDGVPFLETFKLNKSQEKAVSLAANNNFTVITGPPGTGKSQVVLNILANMIYGGKSVLFASKNNKAIDVVRDRFINEILNGNGLEDFIIRLGSKEIVRKTVDQLKILMSKISTGNITFDPLGFRLLKSKLEEINKVINLINKNISLSQTHSKSLTNLLDVNEIIYQAFFNNESFQIDSEQLGFVILDAENLLQNKEIGFIRKILFSLFPFYYRSKYFKILQVYKSKLPFSILNYYNKEKSLSGKYLLADILERLKFLLEIKSYEVTINEIISFILKNIIVDTKSKLDIHLAFQYLLKFVKSLESDLENAHNEKIEISRKLLLEKIKENLNLPGALNAIESYLNNTNVYNFSKDSIKFTPGFQSDWVNNTIELMKYLPVWTVTSLGVRNGIPLSAKVFDLIVIDEASQCDLPSAIPLFYRGKNVCVIGDNMQLKHISGISEEEDCAIASLCGIPKIGGRYTNYSLYDMSENISKLSGNPVTFLDGHYRSHDSIMTFCNKYFYLPKKGAEMMYKTDELNLVFEHKGVFWIDVKGGLEVEFKYNHNELNKCIELYKHFISDIKNKEISFGIATPFRNQANSIVKRLYSEKINNIGEINVTGNTVHVFQGDERDVMFLSLVVSNYATSGMVNFINRYAPQLINVAISRARSAVFIVGDKNYCISQGGLLRNLAQYAVDFKIE